MTFKPKAGLSLRLKANVAPAATLTPLEEGLKQLEEYLVRLRLEAGVLVLFDRRRDAPTLEDRTKEVQAVTAGGRPVRVLRA